MTGFAGASEKANLEYLKCGSSVLALASKDERDLVKLPGAERAFVDPSKIRDYLLSESHPVGRFKAVFFIALGYSAATWEALAEDLRRHAMENEASAVEANPYGQKYEIRGKLIGAAGRSAALVAVWIVLRGEDFPRFVTAFPGAKS